MSPTMRPSSPRTAEAAAPSSARRAGLGATLGLCGRRCPVTGRRGYFLELLPVPAGRLEVVLDGWRKRGGSGRWACGRTAAAGRARAPAGVMGPARSRNVFDVLVDETRVRGQRGPRQDEDNQGGEERDRPPRS